MSTTTPCYENGTAIGRICHVIFFVYQHKMLIYRMLVEFVQNSLICERGRSTWIFFEY